MGKIHAAAQRRDTWHESSAAQAHEDWRKKRQREGKRWMPVNELNEVSVEFSDIEGASCRDMGVQSSSVDSEAESSLPDQGM